MTEINCYYIIGTFVTVRFDAYEMKIIITYQSSLPSTECSIVIRDIFHFNNAGSSLYM